MTRTEVASIDATGVVLRHPEAQPLDLMLSGDRLWSFQPVRDGRRVSGGTRVPWPAVLAERLVGTGAISVVQHLDGAVLFEGDVEFTGSGERLVIADEHGNPLTLDKGGRFQRSFDRMDDASLTELVTTSRQVLDDLVDKTGLDAFLCYGALLGAVRTGHMIGHDSDVDLAWVSRKEHPFDLIRESRRAEKAMRRAGWHVVRMSAANFKVWAPLPNGKRAGIDVFGSFHLGELYHLTGSLRGTLPRDAILPFGSVELEGVEFPAPHDLDAYLAYTYGPGWRVPDPAFHFDHPKENTALMGLWFRSARTRLWHWDPFYRGGRADEVPSTASDFAHWVGGRLPSAASVVELGAGTGRDAVWYAGQGHRVLATDYSWAAQQRIAAAAEEAGVEVQVRGINLASTASWLREGRRAAAQPGARQVVARLLVDALHPQTRSGLWRFCSMACRSGGHTFLEFRTSASKGEPTAFGPHVRTYARVARIEAEIAEHGGTIIEKIQGRGLASLGPENPEVCRLEVSWR